MIGMILDLLPMAQAASGSSPSDVRLVSEMRKPPDPLKDRDYYSSMNEALKNEGKPITYKRKQYNAYILQSARGGILKIEYNKNLEKINQIMQRLREFSSNPKLKEKPENLEMFNLMVDTIERLASRNNRIVDHCNQNYLKPNYMEDEIQRAIQAKTDSMRMSGIRYELKKNVDSAKKIVDHSQNQKQKMDAIETELSQMRKQLQILPRPTMPPLPKDLGEQAAGKQVLFARDQQEKPTITANALFDFSIPENAQKFEDFKNTVQSIFAKDKDKVVITQDQNQVKFLCPNVQNLIKATAEFAKQFPGTEFNFKAKDLKTAIELLTAAENNTPAPVIAKEISYSGSDGKPLIIRFENRAEVQQWLAGQKPTPPKP